MPTDEPRAISELMQILHETGTYQEMSDAEIQSVIDYEKTVSYNHGYNEGLHENNIAMQQHFDMAMAEATGATLQRQSDMIESILNRARNTQLRVIQYG